MSIFVIHYSQLTGADRSRFTKFLALTSLPFKDTISFVNEQGGGSYEQCLGKESGIIYRYKIGQSSLAEFKQEMTIAINDLLRTKNIDKTITEEQFEDCWRSVDVISQDRLDLFKEIQKKMTASDTLWVVCNTNAVDHEKNMQVLAEKDIHNVRFTLSYEEGKLFPSMTDSELVQFASELKNRFTISSSDNIYNFREDKDENILAKLLKTLEEREELDQGCASPDAKRLKSVLS